MKYGSGEFIELQKQFEKDINNTSVYGHKIERADRDKNPAHVFYNDAVINQLFTVYMMGYQNAKCLNRMGALPLDE